MSQILALVVAVVGSLALSGAAAAFPAPSAAAGALITVTDGVSPASLDVVAGTTVRWVNRDDERHRFRSDDGPQRFDSGNLEPGESYAVTVNGVGVYRYIDERDDDDTRYHGTITVRAETGTTGPTEPSRAPEPPGDPGTPEPAAPSSTTVTMAGRSFSPATVTVAVGGQVRFSNNDDREHTATGDGWDTGVLSEGGAATETFPTAGTFAYLCAIHPEMTGTVVVEADANATAPTPRPVATPKPATTPPPRATATSPAEATPTPATGSTAAPVVHLVDFAVSPALLSVAAGTDVEFRNDGEAIHTATAEDGSWDTGFLAPGASGRQRFAARGTYPFICALHPDMKGTIIVEATVGATGPGASATPSAGAGGSTSPPSASPAQAVPPATPAPPASSNPSAAGAAVEAPVASIRPRAAAGENEAEARADVAPSATATRRTSVNLGGVGLAAALAAAAVVAFGLLIRGVARSNAS